MSLKHTSLPIEHDTGMKPEPDQTQATVSSPRQVVPASISKCLRPAQSTDELGRLAHFRILRVLGQGGMGIVFEAIDLQLNRSVALKVLHPETQSNPQACARFLQEAQTCAALRHDHIVPIYQVGEDNGVIFLAMPLLQGMPLDLWLHEHPRPHLMQILKLGREMADGLAAAHAVGIIHRDIKLSNIWLEAPKGRVVLLDFGLAGRQDANTVFGKANECVGTPGYLAPEQARGYANDPRVDLFALGIVLYRLTTGTMPFHAAPHLQDYFTALHQQRPRTLLEHDPALPVAFNELVMALLALNPAARPASAKVVRTALQQIQDELLLREVDQHRSPQDLLKLSLIPLNNVFASSDNTQVMNHATSITTLLRMASPRRRLTIPALILALLLGSMIAMGLWIYEAPLTQVRPTVPISSADSQVRHINARTIVQRIGLVKAPLVKEASALIKSRKHPDIYYTLCDAGNAPYVFAIDTKGKLFATLQPQGAKNLDWEALAMDEDGHIYIGDIGNNYHDYAVRTIYRIEEPDRLDAVPSHTPQVVPVTGTWNYRFPKKRFDAEALLIQDKTIWIINKAKNISDTALYKLPMGTTGSTAILEFAGELPAELLMIADASISADGKWLALVNKLYSVVFELPTGKVTDILTSTPTYYEYDLFKVEGCAWDGHDLILIAEDRHIYRLPIPVEAP